MKVIINADDFGLSEGANKAIIESYKAGTLPSTSLMANTDYTQEAIELAKENPGLGIGVHMVLTTRRPLLTTHKTLIKENGDFKYRPNTLDEAIDLDELYAEWDAQIASIVSEIEVDHLDSHHHVHLHPYLRPVAEKLAKKYNLPMRSTVTHLPNEVICDGNFYKDGVTLEYFENLFKENKHEVVDVMAHPAYVDDHLRNISSYTDGRYKELEIFLDPQLKELIKAYDIELIRYSDL
ncbi:carbohydrate deacetylase [Erysipelothrix urinaevulpis]|uniref:carbohydrate deacetylase n=1 Tax=Erysipelothrix urinaevulpis TaxID=2683717 RepID=UPI001356F978|nr:carbohydrate deacetylase [Erysipelothrix urinaevulpis]